MQVISGSLICKAADHFSVFSSISPPARCIAPAVQGDPRNVQRCKTSTSIDHRSPKRPKTVLSGGRLREMTWWSQTNFFRDHLYHCYGFYLDRLDTPSSFSLISENQLIFRFWAIFDTKFSRYLQFEGTSSLSSVFVQLNSGSIMKKL